MADVPLALDLAKTDEQRQILKLFLTSQETARPFTAPPGIPEDRRAALVAAFDATMKDPEFLAEATKLNLDINPLAGKTITELLDRALCHAESRGGEGRGGGLEMTRWSRAHPMSQNQVERYR